ncbi:MAG: HAD family phosphatase [Nanoarchaeota archaeon]|nr:HAD family phosphatase [Nanoarchaeota archaeon]
MTNIKSIAFDLEGTVVSVENAHHQAHILAAKDVGVTLSLEDCFKSLLHFIGGPDDMVAKEICEIAAQRGLEADPNYVLERKKFHYPHLLTEIEIKPREGFLNFFHKVRAMGIKCTIGSVTTQEQAKILLERSGVGELFGQENIVLREDVQNPKPAPDVWIATAKKAGVNPENQLVFEDSPRGIQGAMEVGASCIGMPVYNCPDTVKDLMDAGAKRIFMQWNEINPENLLKNINQEHAFLRFFPI